MVLRVWALVHRLVLDGLAAAGIEAPRWPDELTHPGGPQAGAGGAAAAAGSARAMV